MKKTKYIIIVLIVLVVLILAIFSGKSIFNSLTDIFDFGADNYNTIIKESVSPDEKYVAYYFKRDVDATTDVSYQLSVCERGESLSNDSGNVFVSSKPFVFEWQSENKLLIVHGNSSENYKKEDSIKDVQIEYSTTLKTGVYTQSDISLLHNVIYRGSAESRYEMPKIFRCSKINLNPTAKSIKTGTSQRVWDILGCGGFLISNYQTELSEHFVLGQDLETYNSMEELEDKCAYYLTHEEERKKIAANGYEKVKKYHTYEIRIQQMLEMM